MSQRPDPDYVDHCIDFISSGRRRCFADLALWAVIIAPILLISPYQQDGGTGNSTWKDAMSNSTKLAALDAVDRHFDRRQDGIGSIETALCRKPTGFPCSSIVADTATCRGF